VLKKLSVGLIPVAVAVKEKIPGITRPIGGIYTTSRIYKEIVQCMPMDMISRCTITPLPMLDFLGEKVG
jgi:hypothetical protein